MLAIKIFDDNKHETLNEKINYAILNQIGLELCMYSELFLNEKEQELVRQIPKKNKSIHANHKYSVFTLAEPITNIIKTFPKKLNLPNSAAQIK